MFKKINISLIVLMVLSAQIVAMEIATRCKKECSYVNLATPDALLGNPVHSFNIMSAVRDEFYAAVDKRNLEKELDLPALRNGLSDLFNKYEQKCPLFMLNECTIEGDCINVNDCTPCVFNRGCNAYRKNFEERVSQKLVEKIASHQHFKIPINYTSFGCGGAFSEVMTITKALMQQPDAHLNIHLIDSRNLSYTSAADYLNYSREIISNQKLFSFGGNGLKRYAEHVKKQAKLAYTVNELQSQIIYTGVLVQKRYQQIIVWLTAMFPQAKLSLFIHDTTPNYLAYLAEYNLPHADVISAADIQDWESLMKKNSFENYIALCTKILEKKSDSCNALLAKHHLSSRVTMDCFFTQETDGARMINFNDVYLYATSEDL